MFYKKVLQSCVLLLLLLGGSQRLFAQVTKTVGGQGGADYATLGSAFSAINSGTLTGNVTLRIIAGTTETSAATLNNNADLSSLTIYPTQSGLSVTGNGAFAVVNLSGADNVTIDGRVNATGSTASLVIENTSTITSGSNRAVLFNNDATYNVLQYCILKSANAASFNAGIIAFGNQSSLSGNDNNRIANCRITHAPGDRSVMAIHSEGSFQANKENSHNEIVDNEFVDCFYTGSVSQAMVVFIGNYNTNWTIRGNHFFETTTPAAGTSSQSITAIGVFCLNGGCTNFTITDNYIGGSARSCGGSALTRSSSDVLNFNGISMSVNGTSGTNSLQGNVIANFNWSGTEVNWRGIEVSIKSSCYIGNLTGNIIGSDVLAGSVQINATSSINRFLGVRAVANADNTIDTLLIANNKVGGTVISTATTSTVLMNGIIVGGNNLKIKNAIIQDNIVGSSSVANSLGIDASVTGGNKSLEGISISNSGINVIAGNVVANIFNTDKTNSTLGGVRGIFAGGGAYAIYDNQVYELSHTGKNFNSTSYAVLQGI